MVIPMQMRQLEISPWPQLRSVPSTNPNGPEFTDARKYCYQHLTWFLVFVEKSCDVLEGGLSKRLVCARNYWPENLASYLSLIVDAHGVGATLC